MWFAFIVVLMATNVTGRKYAFSSFEVNMTCTESEAKSWCAELFVEELDLGFDVQNDDVFHAQFCTDKRNIRFNVEQLQLRGDGIFDHSYEFSYKVYHTCVLKKTKGFHCTDSSPYVRASTDVDTTTKFNIFLKDTDGTDTYCRLRGSYDWFFAPPKTKQFDDMWTKYQITTKGPKGKVTTWSQYRTPNYNVQDI